MPTQPSSPLADCRHAAGYTQVSFAEKVGVDRTTVGRWERGVQSPQPWQRPA
jgi:DNA-binding XRE family transcriptional regulator